MLRTSQDKTMQDKREMMERRLRLPWVQCQYFNEVSRVCETPGGLDPNQKTSVTHLIDELQQGEQEVEAQLADLESRLVAVSDYLDGNASTVFPKATLETVSTSSIEKELMHDPTIVNKNVSLETSNETGESATSRAMKLRENPLKDEEVAQMVSNDLSVETPPTTRGLWNYLYVYSYFYPVCSNDPRLQLEDTNLSSSSLIKTKDNSSAPLKPTKETLSIDEDEMRTLLHDKCISTHWKESGPTKEETSGRYTIHHFPLDELLFEIQEIQESYRRQVESTNAHKRTLQSRLQREGRITDADTVEGQYLDMCQRQEMEDRRRKGLKRKST